MTAAEYLAMVSGGGGKPKRRNKYGNRRGIEWNGQKYDSSKEVKHHQQLVLAMNARAKKDRVVLIERQVPYELLPKQDGERAVKYLADFRVHYADGHVEVHDVKSPPTRADRGYVLKRKLMLAVYNIRIIEI